MMKTKSTKTPSGESPFLDDSYSAISTNLLSHPLYRAIIDSSAFQRLLSIPFLGIHGLFYGKSQGQTRGDHSLAVAMLTLIFSRAIKLRRDEEMRWIASALLHDIHHLPFSHTMDFAVKTELPKFSFGKETNTILRSKSGKHEKSIEEVLDDWGIDVASLPILTPEKEQHWIFSGTHNVDTLDGIPRSWDLMFEQELEHARPIDVIYALVRGSKNNRLSSDDVSILDGFWELKHRVYVDGIYSPTNVLFERIAGYFLFDVARQKNMLEDLTRYRDEDFMDLYPSLVEKMMLLRKAVGDAATFVAGQEASDLHTQQKRSGSYLKLAIIARRFRVDEQHAFRFPVSLTSRTRYRIEKQELVLLLPPDFAQYIEEILDYPLIHERIRSIARDVGERLL